VLHLNVTSIPMRHPTKEDIPAIIDLAKSIKVFDSDEEIDELIRKPLECYLAESDSASSSSQWWVTTAQDANSSSNSSSSKIASASFTGPQPGEEAAFNMYFIGVRPELQGKRLGAAMVSKVEEWAKVVHGALYLLVETSCQMDGAQAFYKKMGFRERKRMKNMYGEGIDAIQYVKEL
jgi:ribosomal protein S18 acetylase RimI-like enzyme